MVTGVAELPCLFSGSLHMERFTAAGAVSSPAGQRRKAACENGHVHQQVETTGDYWLMSGSPEQ